MVCGVNGLISHGAVTHVVGGYRKGYEIALQEMAMGHLAVLEMQKKQDVVTKDNVPQV